MSMDSTFDELEFFAKMKTKKYAALHLGKSSLMSFRDHYFGMEDAFSFYTKESPFVYFHAFQTWYLEEVIRDLNGYACWWNHILYISGNDDVYAYEQFFDLFERYLLTVHHITLPEFSDS